MRTMKRVLPLACAALAVLALAGCEGIFTYSPLAVFQRAPSDLSAAERVTYAEDALASGDEQTMQDAYDAIKGDTSPEASYAAAELAIELSNIPDLFVQMVSGDVTMPTSGDSSSITDYLDQTGVEPELLIAAAAKLQASDPADLTAMDYVYGTLGLALDAAQQPDGTYSFTPADMDVDKLVEAQVFMESAIDTMPVDDPMYAFLSSYNTYIQSL
jgi:hypothetical protein